MSGGASQYIRHVLHHTDPPPPIPARFFYSSLIPIDDPLSPVPPAGYAKTAPHTQRPKPFADYDNTALDRAWHDLRRNILKYHEERGEKSASRSVEGSRVRAGSRGGKEARRDSA
ncbi:phosphatidic acid-preferring phospholipase A1, contains DDHD domain, partial [Teratosphaeria destructans]